MNNRIKELARERAQFAYKKVKEVVKEKKIDPKDYRSYLKKIPTYLQTNGLAATIAFIFAKKKSAYGVIYNQIDEWLQKIQMKNNTPLIEWVVELESPTYRRATKEIIALLMWMGRFAEGMVDK
ncbi:MAG: type III-B CRISPR module-associated protein Cmr5 [Campylobacterales bacterium]